MQYSMKDHKNQPIIKSNRKVYLWTRTEKSGNTEIKMMKQHKYNGMGLV